MPCLTEHLLQNILWGSVLYFHQGQTFLSVHFWLLWANVLQHPYIFTHEFTLWSQIVVLLLKHGTVWASTEHSDLAAGLPTKTRLMRFCIGGCKTHVHSACYTQKDAFTHMGMPRYAHRDACLMKSCRRWSARALSPRAWADPFPLQKCPHSHLANAPL